MVLDQTFSCRCILEYKVLKVLLLTCSGAVLNNLVIISGMQSLPQAPEPLNHWAHEAKTFRGFASGDRPPQSAYTEVGITSGAERACKATVEETCPAGYAFWIHDPEFRAHILLVELYLILQPSCHIRLTLASLTALLRRKSPLGSPSAHPRLSQLT